jgi:hypothetical protein
MIASFARYALISAPETGTAGDLGGERGECGDGVAGQAEDSLLI